ncbi:MAG: hypothetical protein IPM21_12065 [Acidobacteria bacterium]|nr:hypothetical protein [Acidobacteriota bacterium]
MDRNSPGTGLQSVDARRRQYHVLFSQRSKVYWIATAIYRKSGWHPAKKRWSTETTSPTTSSRRPASPDGQNSFSSATASGQAFAFPFRTDSNTIDRIEEPHETLESRFGRRTARRSLMFEPVKTGTNGSPLRGSNGTDRFETFNAEALRVLSGRLAGGSSNATEPEVQGGPQIDANAYGLWWRKMFTAEDWFGNNDGGLRAAYFTGGQLGFSTPSTLTVMRNLLVGIPDNGSLEFTNASYTLAGWVNIQADQREHYFFGKGLLHRLPNFLCWRRLGPNLPFIDVIHESGGSRVAAFGHELISTWTHLALRRGQRVPPLQERPACCSAYGKPDHRHQ